MSTAPPALAVAASPSPAKLAAKMASKPMLGPIKLPQELFTAEMKSKRDSHNDMALAKALDGIQAAATRLSQERAKLLIQSQELHIWDISRDEELKLLRMEKEQLEQQLTVVTDRVSKGLGRDGVIEGLQFALRKSRVERDVERRENDKLFNELQEAKAAQEELRELRKAVGGVLGDLHTQLPIGAIAPDLRAAVASGARDPAGVRAADLAALLRALSSMATRSEGLQQEAQRLQDEQSALQSALDAATRQAAELEARARAHARHDASPNRLAHMAKHVAELEAKVAEYRAYLQENQGEIEALQGELRRARQEQQRQQAPQEHGSPHPERLPSARDQDRAGSVARRHAAAADAAKHSTPTRHAPPSTVAYGASPRALSDMSPSERIIASDIARKVNELQELAQRAQEEAATREQELGGLHQAELEALREQLNELHARQLGSLRSELLRQHAQELEALRLQLAQQHAQALLEAQERQADQSQQQLRALAELQAQNAHAASQHAHLAAQHAQAVQELERQHARRLAQREDELQRMHADALAHARAQAEAALGGALAEQAARLAAQHAEELRQHEARLAAQHAQHVQQAETRLAERFAEEQARRDAETRRRHAERLAEQAAQLAAIHAEQAGALAAQHASALAEREGQLLQLFEQQLVEREGALANAHADQLREHETRAEQRVAAAAAAAAWEREAQLEGVVAERLAHVLRAHAAEAEARAEQRLAAQAEALAAQHAADAAEREAAAQREAAARVAQMQVSFMGEMGRLAQEHEEEATRREAHLRQQLDAARSAAADLELRLRQAEEAAEAVAEAAEAAQRARSRADVGVQAEAFPEGPDKAAAEAAAAIERQYVEVVARLGREHETAVAEARAVHALREENLRKVLESERREAKEEKRRWGERLGEMQDQLSELQALVAKERQQHEVAQEAAADAVMRMADELAAVRQGEAALQEELQPLREQALRCRRLAADAQADTEELQLEVARLKQSAAAASTRPPAAPAPPAPAAAVNSSSAAAAEAGGEAVPDDAAATPAAPGTSPPAASDRWLDGEALLWPHPRTVTRTLSSTRTATDATPASTVRADAAPLTDADLAESLVQALRATSGGGGLADGASGAAHAGASPVAEPRRRLLATDAGPGSDSGDDGDGLLFVPGSALLALLASASAGGGPAPAPPAPREEPTAAAGGAIWEGLGGTRAALAGAANGAAAALPAAVLAAPEGPQPEQPGPQDERREPGSRSTSTSSSSGSSGSSSSSKSATSVSTADSYDEKTELVWDDDEDDRAAVLTAVLAESRRVSLAGVAAPAAPPPPLPPPHAAPKKGASGGSEAAPTPAPPSESPEVGETGARGTPSSSGRAGASPPGHAARAASPEYADDWDDLEATLSGPFPLSLLSALQPGAPSGTAAASPAVGGGGGGGSVTLNPGQPPQLGTPRGAAGVDPEATLADSSLFSASAPEASRQQLTQQVALPPVADLFASLRASASPSAAPATAAEAAAPAQPQGVGAQDLGDGRDEAGDASSSSLSTPHSSPAPSSSRSPHARASPSSWRDPSAGTGYHGRAAAAAAAVTPLMAPNPLYDDDAQPSASPPWSPADWDRAPSEHEPGTSMPATPGTDTTSSSGGGNSEGGSSSSEASSGPHGGVVVVDETEVVALLRGNTGSDSPARYSTPHVHAAADSHARRRVWSIHDAAHNSGSSGSSGGGAQTPPLAAAAGRSSGDDDDTRSLLAAGATLGSSELRRRQRRRMGDAAPTPAALDPCRWSWEFSGGPTSASRQSRVQGHAVGPPSPRTAPQSPQQPQPQGSELHASAAPGPAAALATPAAVQTTSSTDVPPPSELGAETPASAARAAPAARFPSSPASLVPMSAAEARRRGRSVLGRVLGRVADLEELVSTLASKAATPAQASPTAPHAGRSPLPRPASSPGASSSSGAAAAILPMPLPVPHTVAWASPPRASPNASPHGAAAAPATPRGAHSPTAAAADGVTPVSPTVAAGVTGALEQLRADLLELEGLHELSMRGGVGRAPGTLRLSAAASGRPSATPPPRSARSAGAAAAAASASGASAAQAPQLLATSAAAPAASAPPSPPLLPGAPDSVLISFVSSAVQAQLQGQLSALQDKVAELMRRHSPDPAGSEAATPAPPGGFARSPASGGGTHTPSPYPAMQLHPAAFAFASPALGAEHRALAATDTPSSAAWAADRFATPLGATAAHDEWPHPATAAATPSARAPASGEALAASRGSGAVPWTAVESGDRPLSGGSYGLGRAGPPYGGPYSPEELARLPPAVQLFAPPQLRAAAVAAAHEQQYQHQQHSYYSNPRGGPG